NSCRLNIVQKQLNHLMLVTLDVTSGALLSQFELVNSTHLSSAVQSRDGQLAAILDDRGNTHIYDINACCELCVIETHVNVINWLAIADMGVCALTFSPDGKRLAAIDDCNVTICDILQGKTTAQSSLSSASSGIGINGFYSTDGKMLWTYNSHDPIWRC